MKDSKQRSVTLLDGGLATELEALGCDLNHPLWSAVVLERDPEVLLRAYERFLDAGAEVLSTVGYQLSFEGAARLGWTRERTSELLVLATRLAQQARSRFHASESILIAGSIGPYGAMLADGSEYRGDYGVTAAVLRDFHHRRLACVVESGVDLLAFETIPSELEARVLLDLLGEQGQPGWLSFTLKDEKSLSDGSELQGLVSRLAAASPSGFEQLIALGFNCAPASRIDGAIEILREQAERLGVALVVYPNSGESWDARVKKWLPAETTGKSVASWPIERWLAAGARYIGGCCRVTPEDIAALAARLP